MLGNHLRELRGKKTQQEIAEKLGVSRARYSHYENERVQPDTDLLRKMAELFGVTVDYLLDTESSGNLYELPQQKTEWIIREIVTKYNLDLTEDGIREKLEDIIKIVFDDYKGRNN